MELELKDYFRIVMKRIKLILWLVVVAAIITAIFSYWFMKPVYESSTKLIVNNSQDMTRALDINSVNLDIRLVDTYKQIIKTAAITDKVAEQNPQLGLTGEQINSMISVSSVSNTQVLTISARNSDYPTTVAVVNEVAKVFVEEIPNIMTVNNVSILNEAKQVENPSPVAPNPIMNIALSIIVALLLGIGLALLLEYLDDTIKDEQDVLQYVDLPVLMSIPSVTEEDLKIGKQSAAKVRTEVGRNVTVSK
ncbi:capsular polysaccharide type 5/8 biosynthesis protein CapA [Paenibacillus montaniterrae]|uniref:Capsular polysaccharide type 5/8 biosynthesis protein CapA n=1 Tax=Paenibacillus montaniterrae TaxID=429341 RepID=A0A920CYZ3_9BACL|nr:Wzz/FepE/Etk N-terminal domain-containing protein [Paenibacillus montaniterrae]GIP16494.1 capsular polysaccharide type 5/8 biosynthesis protein CapA [Paenibacillus montaniterrae]